LEIAADVVEDGTSVISTVEKLVDGAVGVVEGAVIVGGREGTLKGNSKL
jgi:hypothetical protein